MKAKMTYVKSTKNTKVYAAADEESDAVMPKLYIKNGALPIPAPEHITVTIEVGHNDDTA
ncbi:hypothetical protein NVP1055O_52 [Vibrio phage 1.055.O._10N.286.55.E9]|nr:hypothetical protein NVP1055O_52 [Vibrio phage 1.055.O._10N.286.55.E9]